MTGFTIDQSQAADGTLHLRLAGVVGLDTGPQVWQRLVAVQRTVRERAPRAVLDLTAVERIDGVGAALLLDLQSRWQDRGGSLEMIGAGPQVAGLLARYACPSGDCEPAPEVRPRGALDQIGRFALELRDDVRRMFGFVGDFAVGVARAVRRPRSVQWSDLGQLVERAGADGLPIVLLLNLLVGLVLGLQGALQLRRFGAQDWLPNLVGLSVVRELGPLMTAILVAGRSGAGYAAEIGAMKVGEEIDALRTLGFDPHRFLVLPRILALVIVVPIMTALGNVAGIVGGMVIGGIYLSRPALSYLSASAEAVQFHDVAGGLLKSGAFALWIGLVACKRGLDVRGGAASVGYNTTTAVVVGLFGLIVLDTMFTWAYSVIGW